MDLEDTLLMMPGLVPVAPRVLRAMSISVSEKAFEAMSSVKKRPYYNDLKAYKKSGDKPRPESPPYSSWKSC